MSEALLSVKQLYKSYKEGNEVIHVLRDVNVDIMKGERVAIMGPSGTGKTTFLNIISGLDKPDKGTVIVAGNDLTTMSVAERTRFRRTHVGFVFQHFNLIHSMTALENVSLPLLMTGHSLKEAKKMAEQLLDRVGLLDRKDAYPHVLSGGERQRVAIARALIHRPTVVFADEPTGNLDRDHSEQVLRLMKELSDEFEQTMVIVTHDATVAKICDRIYHLNGQLKEVTIDSLKM